MNRNMNRKLLVVRQGMEKTLESKLDLIATTMRSIDNAKNRDDAEYLALHNLLPQIRSLVESYNKLEKIK